MEGDTASEMVVILPSELINEILLRLPVKSLLRFKTVCKSWLFLISGPRFAKSHFQLAAARTERLAFVEPRAIETQSIDHTASFHDDSACVLLKSEFLKPYDSVELYCSCRGFLLLTLNRSTLCLWNPSIGVHKFIEPSPMDKGYDPTTFFIGLGYDPSRDDYLVVLAFKNDARREFRVEYFSLRADVWKEIETSHLSYKSCKKGFHDNNQDGTFLNGVIHWLAFSYDKSMDVIVAFDLIEMSFSEIPMPVFGDNKFRACYLRVHGELLSLCAEMLDHSLEIWVMQEYKVQSSWTKIIVVPNDVNQAFYLICFTKSSVILATDGFYTMLEKYNDKGELQEHRSYRKVPYPFHVVAAAYTESLLSLPYDDEQVEEDG